jgi:hypothetical protein
MSAHETVAQIATGLGWKIKSLVDIGTMSRTLTWTDPQGVEHRSTTSMYNQDTIVPETAYAPIFEALLARNAEPAADETDGRTPAEVEGDPAWHVLGETEKIRAGDEWFNGETWKLAKQIGAMAGYGYLYRRSTTRAADRRTPEEVDESPGWRILNASDTIRSGDELFDGCQWVPVMGIDVGVDVRRCTYLFRRRVIDEHLELRIARLEAQNERLGRCLDRALAVEEIQTERVRSLEARLEVANAKIHEVMADNRALRTEIAAKAGEVIRACPMCALRNAGRGEPMMPESVTVTAPIGEDHREVMRRSTRTEPGPCT